MAWIKWSTEETKFVLDNRHSMTTAQMAATLNRTLHTVQWKLAQLNKQNYLFGDKHQEDKLSTTMDFIDTIDFNYGDVVLDAFCGQNKIYEYLLPNCIVFSNDTNKFIDCDNYDDASIFLKAFVGVEGVKLIDIDPFGCAAPYIETALSIIEPDGGLIITDGFIGRPYCCTTRKIKANSRQISTVYGFKTYKDLHIDFVVDGLNKLAMKYYKQLKLHTFKNWNGQWRMYFNVEETTL
jgi:hypothetical protein